MATGFDARFAAREAAGLQGVLGGVHPPLCDLGERKPGVVGEVTDLGA